MDYTNNVYIRPKSVEDRSLQEIDEETNKHWVKIIEDMSNLSRGSVQYLWGTVSLASGAIGTIPVGTINSLSSYGEKINILLDSFLSLK